MTNGQHLKEKTLRCQSRCCTIKDFKTAIITMLHEVKVNTLEMNGKIQFSFFLYFILFFFFKFWCH